MSIIDDLLSTIQDSTQNVVSNVQTGVKNVALQVKAESAANLIQSIVGYKPSIVYANNKAYLAWNKNDIPTIQAKLSKVISFVKKPATDKEINIAYEPVVYPVMIKKALPFALAAVAAGFIIGKVL